MADKIIIYSTFYNPIEANIVKARLTDAGFNCFLTDEYVSTIQPLYNQAIGGVKLNVFENDVDEINALLSESSFDDNETSEIALNEEEIVCPECGSKNVSYGQATKDRYKWWVILIACLLFVFPFLVNKAYHCYDCRYEFK